MYLLLLLGYAGVKNGGTGLRRDRVIFFVPKNGDIMTQEGKTSGLSIARIKRKSVTGKLHVIILADKMVAIGPRVVEFVTEIFMVVQKLTFFAI
ncbi:hypothetical protein CR513_60417, partial [Mucuna pruriens]